MISGWNKANCKYNVNVYPSFVLHAGGRRWWWQNRLFWIRAAMLRYIVGSFGATAGGLWWRKSWKSLNVTYCDCIFINCFIILQDISRLPCVQPSCQITTYFSSVYHLLDCLCIECYGKPHPPHTTHQHRADIYSNVCLNSLSVKTRHYLCLEGYGNLPHTTHEHCVDVYSIVFLHEVVHGISTFYWNARPKNMWLDTYQNSGILLINLDCILNKADSAH